MNKIMDTEVPVLAGYLNVPMQSSFSLNRISKKKNCHRYCLLFNSSQHGIERLEICESKDDKNPKIVTLENCVKITQEPPPANIIQVIKKTESLTLNTLTEEDLKEWTNALQMVAFRNKSSMHTAQAAIEEDNDLYCSSFGDGLFIITLIPSETSIRCNLESKSYILHLTATELQLKSTDDLNEIIARWPYRFIRKYGYRDGKFTFEAGRKCCTGEGIFTLDHTNPQEIFRCMAAKMKSMKKLINCDNLNNDVSENQWIIAANMEAGSRSPLAPNNQQCLSIENNSQSGVSYREFTTSSDSLNSCFVNNNSMPILLPPIIKQVPNKPPRKLQSAFPSSTNSNKSLLHGSNLNFQTNSDKLCKYQNYDAVSITTSSDPNKTIGSTLVIKPFSPECARKQNLQQHKENNSVSGAERDYESIETVTDAWKTLGIDEVKHTERILGDHNEESFIEPSWQRAVSGTQQRSLKETFLHSKVPRVIDIDIGEGGGGSATCNNARNIDDTYDRLDFMSPNNNTSSGYNTIVSVVSPARKRCDSPSLSDYELIGNPEIQFSKKPDTDGGGSIRNLQTNVLPCQSSLALKCNIVGSKYFDSAVGQQMFAGANLTPSHENYSGINYTIVSKPKRV
ncbi:uncharacterized protein LOC101450146 [Ceratitis capitata]|uniref:Docking protein 2 n=1 Tax=Ceratitis capitata TaxID=7213 RepID=W8BUY2_CERCA|nr:uncharacterized protein LOC101450146 [Ceratitis capitata]